MIYEYLSIISSILVVIGYIPELYNLIYCIFMRQPYNEYSNKLIWFIWLGASTFGLSYGICIENKYLIINYGINTLLNCSIFVLRNYKNKENNVLDKNVLDKNVLDKNVLDKNVLDKNVLDKNVIRN